ncbi:unnamed protein product [Closterium sp. NIES-53]
MGMGMGMGMGLRCIAHTSRDQATWPYPVYLPPLPAPFRLPSISIPPQLPNPSIFPYLSLSFLPALASHQVLLILTASEHFCLFSLGGQPIKRQPLLHYDSDSDYSSYSAAGHGRFGLVFHPFLSRSGRPIPSFQNSVAAWSSGAAAFVLLQGGGMVVRAHLLSWKERIKSLEAAGDWMNALHTSMEIYQGRAVGVTGLPCDLEELAAEMGALLLAYIEQVFSYLKQSAAALNPKTLSPAVLSPVSLSPVNASPESSPRHPNSSRSHLHTTAAEMSDSARIAAGGAAAVSAAAAAAAVVAAGAAGGEQREEYVRVGGVAIEFCIRVCQLPLLFGAVFDKFTQRGQRGIFLELLEPYILTDHLSTLPPEVMQALVEHYSERGWLSRVQQCVLHMDIASLDINQVVRLCRQHSLHSALIYLFTRALADFVSPAQQLLSTLLASSSSSKAHGHGFGGERSREKQRHKKQEGENKEEREEGRECGYRLLLFLKLTFSGLNFPPGSGAISPSLLPSAQSELLNFLLKPHRPPHHRPSSLSPSSHALLCSPLARLLSFDPRATLSVLRVILRSVSILDQPQTSTEQPIMSEDSTLVNGRGAGAAYNEDDTVDPAAGGRLVYTLLEIVRSWCEAGDAIRSNEDSNKGASDAVAVGLPPAAAKLTSSRVASTAAAGSEAGSEQGSDVGLGLGLGIDRLGDAAGRVLELVAEAAAAGRVELDRLSLITIFVYLTSATVSFDLHALPTSSATAADSTAGAGAGAPAASKGAVQKQHSSSSPSSPPSRPSLALPSPSVRRAQREERMEGLVMALPGSCGVDFNTLLPLALQAGFHQVRVGGEVRSDGARERGDERQGDGGEQMEGLVMAQKAPAVRISTPSCPWLCKLGFTR